MGRVLRAAGLALAVLALGVGCGDDEDDADPSGDYDPCAGKACGEQCTLCAPNDTGCVEPEAAVLKYCNAAGECRPEPAVCR